ncbi:MAG: hypothetical protein LBU98_03185 [Alistipes sp.]|jgi:hypothetical protein|nr:hypothetical protein [Alistipes sp.]
MATKPKPTGTSTGEKILKGSFWVIAAIHITVFTVIGVTTRQWRLLVIFLIGFVAVMAAWTLFKLWQARKKTGPA